MVGYTGLLSVMHAAFYGIGAYAVALLMTQLGLNFFLAIGVSVLVAVAVSFVVGLVLSKLEGDCYALGSLGFGVILYSVFLSWKGLTRGALGIPHIPKPVLFGFEFSHITMFLVLVLVLLVGVYLFSPFCGAVVVWASVDGPSARMSERFRCSGITRCTLNWWCL